jgi:hypothetical protein
MAEDYLKFTKFLVGISIGAIYFTGIKLLESISELNDSIEEEACFANAIAITNGSKLV